MAKRQKQFIKKLKGARFRINKLHDNVWNAGCRYAQLVTLSQSLVYISNLTPAEQLCAQEIEKQAELFIQALKVVEDIVKDWKTAIKDLADTVNPDHGLDWLAG